MRAQNDIVFSIHFIFQNYTIFLVLLEKIYKSIAFEKDLC